MEEQMSNESSNLSCSTTNDEEDQQDEEIRPLSGKPFFSVVLSKTHLHPINRMVLPSKITPLLPSIVVPMVLKYRGKNWDMIYDGTSDRFKKFDASWRSFAEDNNLRVGDACVFELEENNPRSIVFKVQILRGDIPPELLPKIAVGTSAESPIIIK